MRTALRLLAVGMLALAGGTVWHFSAQQQRATASSSDGPDTATPESPSAIDMRVTVFHEPTAEVIARIEGRCTVEEIGHTLTVTCDGAPGEQRFERAPGDCTAIELLDEPAEYRYSDTATAPDLRAVDESSCRPLL